MAVDARKRLASWPRDHYGYRADDVREILGMLDEAISELRVAAGETSFRDRSGGDTAGAAPPGTAAIAQGTDAGAGAFSQAIAVAKVSGCGIRSALDSPDGRGGRD